MLSKTNNDIKFIKQAIGLAKERVGLTGNNPSVGCIIVKKNRLISTGQTGIGGTPHAEVNAINNSKESLKGSTLYVSLEPCSHYGKTPPCTKKIIKSKIKKVVYSINDIDDRTEGKSLKIFRKNNILCKNNILKRNALNLYKSYFHIKKSNFPYVTAKIACTKNFLIKDKNKYISNKYSLDFSHLLRYKNHGILISYKTANADNPKLDCRLSGLNKFSPHKIIIDKDLKIKKNLNLMKSLNKSKTFIFYNKKNLKFKFLKNKGLKLIYCPIDENKNLDLIFIMKKIKKLNIHYLLVEGGVVLTRKLLKKNLINCFYLFKSDKISKLGKKYKILDIVKSLRKKFSNSKKIQTYLENDSIMRYYN